MATPKKLPECIECDDNTDEECVYCSEPICDNCVDIHYEYSHPEEA